MDLLHFPEPVEHDFDPRSRLANLLAERTKERDPLRGDDLDQQFAHFSDLGFCRLATHARRSGKTRFVPTTDHALLFYIGHTFEDWAADALGDLTDWNVRHGLDLLYAIPAVHPDTPGYEPVSFGTVPGDRFAEVRVSLLAQRAVIGHPDIILSHKTAPLGHLIDCKTTTFSFVNGRRGAPLEAKPSDLLQTAGYAVALDEMRAITGRAFPFFSIWIGDKAGGGQGFLTYRTADFTALIVHGLRDLMTVTDPKAPEPPASPPLYSVTVPSRGPNKGVPRSWICQRCPYLTCVRNENGKAFAEEVTA